MYRIERHFEGHGFGLWAVESQGDFVGFAGLAVPRFHVAWMDDREQPVVEVGWRLQRSAWSTTVMHSTTRNRAR